MLMSSGGGSRLPSMVSARGTTKEVKGNMWVHRRGLGADGDSGEDPQRPGSSRGGLYLFF